LLSSITFYFITLILQQFSYVTLLFFRHSCKIYSIPVRPHTSKNQANVLVRFLKPLPLANPLPKTQAKVLVRFSKTVTYYFARPRSPTHFPKPKQKCTACAVSLFNNPRILHQRTDALVSGSVTPYVVSFKVCDLSIFEKQIYLKKIRFSKAMHNYFHTILVLPKNKAPPQYFTSTEAAALTEACAFAV
jgi:hypothetical protein